MVYPDGSGALTYFNQDKIIRDLRAKLSVYSPEQTDIDAIAQNREDGIQPLMLPVFGLARADGNAFVGMIDAGEADSTINLAFPGLLVDLYRIGPEFKYRKRYAYETAEGEEIITIDKAIIRQDCGVTFVPLDGEDADYSGMAAACRRWLLDTGRMVPVSSGDQMPLALDLFMGILEERMIFNQYIGMTTFDQAREILEGLREAGADHMVVTLVGSGRQGVRRLYRPVHRFRLGRQRRAEETGRLCGRMRNPPAVGAGLSSSGGGAERLFQAERRIV